MHRGNVTVIEPKYEGVELDVHHNNHEQGFSGQFFKTDEKDEGNTLTKLVIRR